MKPIRTFIALIALCIALPAAAEDSNPQFRILAGTPAVVCIKIGIQCLTMGSISGNAFTPSGVASPPPSFMLGGVLKGANFNSTVDQAIAITSPSPNYRINSIIISNPSISMTTAVGGLYSAAAKGGIPIVASTQAYSALTTNAVNTSGNVLLSGQSTVSSGAYYNLSTIYLSLTTPQGAVATADVYIYIVPLP